MDRYWVPTLSTRGNVIGYRPALPEHRIASCPTAVTPVVLPVNSGTGKCVRISLTTAEYQLLGSVVSPSMLYFPQSIVQHTVQGQPRSVMISPGSPDSIASTSTYVPSPKTLSNREMPCGDWNPQNGTSALPTFEHSGLTNAYSDRISSSLYYTAEGPQESSDRSNGIDLREELENSEWFASAGGPFSLLSDMFTSIRNPDLTVAGCLMKEQCSYVLSESIEHWCSNRSEPVECVSRLRPISFGHRVNCTQPTTELYNVTKATLPRGCQFEIYDEMTASEQLNPSRSISDKVAFDGKSPRTDYGSFLQLFLQNSAVDDEQRVTANTSSLATHAVRKPSAPSRASLQKSIKPNESSEKISITRKSLADPSEPKSLPTDSPLAGQLDNVRLSQASLCGIKVNPEDLDKLKDIPLEFTGAELCLRRAARDESLYGEDYRVCDQKNSTEVASAKRSSILLNSAMDFNGRKASQNGEIRRTVSDVQSTPRVQRSSLCVVYPPRNLFTRETDSPEERLPDELECNSKRTLLSWATVDSTEISRGMKLMGFGFGGSSSELFEALNTMKELVTGHELKDQSTQVRDSQLTQTAAGSPNYSTLSFTTGTLTPGLHYCMAGQHGTGLAAPQRSSPDATGLIEGMKKLAIKRNRSKWERLSAPRNGSATSRSLDLSSKSCR